MALGVFRGLAARFVSCYSVQCPPINYNNFLTVKTLMVLCYVEYRFYKATLSVVHYSLSLSQITS